MMLDFQDCGASAAFDEKRAGHGGQLEHATSQFMVI